MENETNETNEHIEAEAILVKLPLWKNCLESMVQGGVKYGDTYPAEFFEKELRCGRDEMKFGLALSLIRRELEELGFYISGRGQKGNQYVILPPGSNSDVGSNYEYHAIDCFKRGLKLLASTPQHLLSEEEKRKHEKIQNRIAIRLALIRRSVAIEKFVKKTNPKLLE